MSGPASAPRRLRGLVLDPAPLRHDRDYRFLWSGQAISATGRAITQVVLPYQVYVLPQRLSKTVFAGTTTITFAAINLVKLLPYWQLGQLDLANLKISMLLVPIAVAGTFIGVWLVRIIPQRTYFVTIHVALFVLSIKLAADAVK